MSIVKNTLSINSTRQKPSELEFSRNSSATRVTNTGLVETVAAGEIRWDFNPTDVGHKRGYLLEETSTNTLLQSEDFGTTWSTTTSTITNATTVNTNNTSAPDGNATADLIRCTATNATCLVGVRQTGLTYTTGTSYTVSTWAKAGQGMNYLEIANKDSSGAGFRFAQTFNLSTGATGSSSGTVDAKTIEGYPGGWYRCTVTFTGAASNTEELFLIGRTDDATVSSVSATTNDGIYLWGAQLEAKKYPTSYIATTTASAVRAADIAYVSDTDDSWNWNVGITIHVEGRALNTTETITPIWHYQDNDNSNYMTLQSDGYIKCVTDSVSQLSPNPCNTAFSFTSKEDFMSAMVVSSNHLHLAQNGSLSPNLPDTSINVPSKSASSDYKIKFFHGTGLTQGSGWLSNFKIFPNVVTDTNLKNLTLRNNDDAQGFQVNAVQILDGSITNVKIGDDAISPRTIATDAVTTDAILADNITNALIGPNAVTATEIAAGTITGTEIAANSITSAHLGLDVIVAEDIAANAITVSELQNNAVITAKILDLNVTEAKIANLNVTRGKIAADAIDGTKIADDAIGAEHLATGAVTADSIGTGQVTTTEILDGTILEADLSNDAVTADKLASNAVVTASIVADNITNALIADNAIQTENITDSHVTLAKLATGSVDENKIAGSAVRETHIADLNVTTGKLADDSVTDAKLADHATLDASRAVGTNHIKDLNVTTGKLANDAVTDAKLADHAATDALRAVGTNHIKDLNVTEGKLAAGAVTNSKIGADAITSAELADNSVDSEHYVDLSIDTAHIGNLQITEGKLAGTSVTNTKIGTNAVTTSKIADNQVTIAKLAVTDGNAGQVLTTDGNGVLSFAADSTNVGATAVGGDVTGTVSNITIPAGSITSAMIGVDVIVAEDLAANSITVSEISDNAVNGAKIAMGSDARGDILYYNGTDYARLAKGSSGQVLTMGANDPAWSADSTNVGATAVGGMLTGTVSNITIPANTITSSMIAAGVIVSQDIATNAVNGTHIALGSDAAGDTMYYNGTDYVRLAKGTANQVLTMNAGATAPEWAADSTNVGTTSMGGMLGGTVANASINAGVVTPTMLSTTGTASSTTFLRGDGAWAVPPQATESDPTATAKAVTMAIALG